MVLRPKVWLLLSLVSTILAFILLSSGLSSLELRSGTLFDAQARQELRSLIAQLYGFRGWLLAIIGLGLLVGLFWSASFKPRVGGAPGRRNEFISVLVQAILWIVAIYVLRRKLLENHFTVTPPALREIPQLIGEDSVQSVSAPISDWLAFLASLTLIVLLGWLVWGFWKRRSASSSAKERLVERAQSAIEELLAGSDLQSVILRCYLEMSQTVSRERGIRRKQAMTPREFEGRLVESGLPREPVEQLTRLFEAVRYGAKQPGEEGERQALACLQAIVQASGGMR